MVAEHIIKSYDQELQRLDNSIAEMGGMAESQLAAAIDAVSKRDGDLATSVIEADGKVDELEHEVEAQVVRLLALRQPMARDLRQIVAALKTSTDLERICDYAANVAKRSLVLNQSAPVKPVYALPRMGAVCQAHDQGHARCLCRARRRQGLRGLAARRRARRDVYEPLPRASHLHDRGCAQHHGLHASPLHGQESGAHRRPHDEHRRDALLPRPRQAAGADPTETRPHRSRRPPPDDNGHQEDVA